MCRSWKTYGLLIVLVMLIMTVAGLALAQEPGGQPEKIKYVGGVVERGHISGMNTAVRGLDEKLNIVYASPQQSELTVGEESVWQIVAEGGTTPYTYEYSMFYKPLSDPSDIHTWVGGSSAPTQDASFRFVIQNEGWYILQCRMTDATGSYLVFQSPRYVTVTNELRQVVTQVAAQYATSGMSDYEKALALHDYLCEAAVYDDSLFIHDPSGVLLQGKGVCESFALAYQMLLNEVNIENILVAGYGNNESHVWNLIKLDGEWYHVDVTWDEARTDRYYFGMNDALIKRSHTLTTRAPAATATRYNAAMNASDGVFSSLDELFELFAYLPEGQNDYCFYYAGSGLIGDQFTAWCETNGTTVGLASYGCAESEQHTLYVYGTARDESGSSQTASYGGFTFNAGRGDITIQSYTGTEAHVVVPAKINGRKVKSLVQNCFYQNNAVESIIISEGVEQIAPAFAAGCSNLKLVSIPSTASLNAAFAGVGGLVDACNAMETVLVAEENPYLCVVDNVLYNKAKTKILYYPAQSRNTVLRIPEGVQTIESGTFSGNAYLQEVVLPDSVTSIGYFAFEFCRSLKKINIPENCTSIGQFAFWGTQISDIHLPAGLTGVGCPSFVNGNLQTITVEAGNPKYCAVDNVLFSNDMTALYAYAGKKTETVYAIPDTVWFIGQQAFDSAGNLTDLVLSESIDRIMYSAFSDCYNLKNVYVKHVPKEYPRWPFGASVTIVGSAAETQAFAEANGYPFRQCEHNRLTDIPAVAPDCINAGLSEGKQCFFCGKMVVAQTAVDALGHAEVIDPAIAPTTTATGLTEGKHCSVCGEVLVAQEVLPVLILLETIGEEAYSGSNFSAVYLPDGCKAIESRAFANCTNLREIHIPASVTVIENDAFEGCNQFTIYAPKWSHAVFFAEFHHIPYVEE